MGEAFGESQGQTDETPVSAGRAQPDGAAGPIDVMPTQIADRLGGHLIRAQERDDSFGHGIQATGAIHATTFRMDR